jgi:hypothetical protein
MMRKAVLVSDERVRYSILLVRMIVRLCIPARGSSRSCLELEP